MNFKDLKKNASKNLDKLVGELNKSSKSYIDPRFWKPTTDPATGRGTALIRFLPAPIDNTVPWVMYYSYSFQGPGGYYIENSPHTLDKPCPVYEDNNRLWTTGIEDNKNIVRKRSQRKNYIANILVLSDPKNPENEGKVFLYNFGAQVFKKIGGAMQPEFDDKKAFDPFDFWNGANFRIRIKKGENKLPTYEDSEFESITALMEGDDAELEKIWKQEYDLNEFISDKNFKSYEELKARFDRVTGQTRKQERTEAVPKPVVVPAPVKQDTSTEDVPWTEEATGEVVVDDNDDSLSFLEELKNK